MYTDSSSSSSSDSDESHRIPIKKRISAISSRNNRNRRRINNIWKNISDSQNLGSLLLSASCTTLDKSKDSESYMNQDSKSEEPFTKNQLSPLKTTGTVKSRLGERVPDPSVSRDHVGLSEESSIKETADRITELLHEDKTGLIESVVSVIGVKRSLDLYYMTADVEDRGGMLTMDGSRRRTPGGVFLYLLKTTSNITKEEIKAIFEEEFQLRNLIRKANRKRLKNGSIKTQLIVKKVIGPEVVHFQESSTEPLEEGELSCDEPDTNNSNIAKKSIYFEALPPLSNASSEASLEDYDVSIE